MFLAAGDLPHCGLFKGHHSASKRRSTIEFWLKQPGSAVGRHNEKDNEQIHSMKIDSTSPAMSKIESSSSPSGGEGIRFDKHATTEEIIGGTISVCGPQTSGDVSPQPALLSMHANPEDSDLVDARLSGSKQIRKNTFRIERP